MIRDPPPAHIAAWHPPMAKCPLVGPRTQGAPRDVGCLMLRSSDPHFHEPEQTRRARWQAKQNDELRDGSLSTPRTAATEAYAAECRAQIRLRYPGLDLDPMDDVLMFCPQRDHPAHPCNFHSNDLRLVDEHFSQNPHHRVGKVKVNRCIIRYEGEEAQLPAAAQHVFIGPDPISLPRS